MKKRVEKGAKKDRLEKTRRGTGDMKKKKVRLEKDKKGKKKEEEKECGGRPWFQVAALALATASPRPATATLHHHLVHLQSTV